MTARQLNEWDEYDQLEPFGFPSEDARTGILSATVLWSQGAKDVKPSDFSIAGDARVEEEVDAKKFAKALAAQLGAVEVPPET